jgi:hypothetical protein
MRHGGFPSDPIAANPANMLLRISCRFIWPCMTISLKSAAVLEAAQEMNKVTLSPAFSDRQDCDCFSYCYALYSTYLK